MAVVLLPVAVSLLTVWLTMRGLRQRLPSMFMEYIKGEDMRIKQTAAANSRVTNEANKKIGDDVLHNTPLTLILEYLTPETIEYLEEHPDAIPGVIKTWAPLLDIVKEVVPGIMNKLKQREAPQYTL